MIAIKRFSSADADFKQRLDDLLAFESAQDESVDRTVAAILADVKARGDAAVVEYTNRFDRLAVKSIAELELTRSELQHALDGLPKDQRDALEARFGEAQAARLEWKPNLTVELDEEGAASVLKFIDLLDDHDDVQQVYANFEVSDAVLAKLSG